MSGYCRGQMSRAFLSVVLILAAFVSSAAAQDARKAVMPASPQSVLTVAIKEAPPFTFKSVDGNWTGIGVDLWKRIASRNNIEFKFVEEDSVHALIEGAAKGRFDVVVTALTVTAERERVLDFTHPFFTTGLGIAVSASATPSWMPVVRALTSFGFLQAVLALIGLALSVGLLVWVLERRHNEDFGGNVVKGLSSSVWWTTAAMTQRGAGHFRPKTLPGRLVSIIWMVGSIIAIAVFTAGITSALTIKQLQGVVHSVGDLSNARVGLVADTAAEGSLDRLRIPYQGFATVQDGLRAVRSNTLDAFVYDRPLLGWTAKREFPSSVELLDTTFEPQNYAFALRANSPLREPLNITILETLESHWWEQTLFRYLGYR